MTAKNYIPRDAHLSRRARWWNHLFEITRARARLKRIYTLRNWWWWSTRDEPSTVEWIFILTRNTHTARALESVRRSVVVDRGGRRGDEQTFEFVLASRASDSDIRARSCPRVKSIASCYKIRYRYVSLVSTVRNKSSRKQPGMREFSRPVFSRGGRRNREYGRARECRLEISRPACSCSVNIGMSTRLSRSEIIARDYQSTCTAKVR